MKFISIAFIALFCSTVLAKESENKEVTKFEAPIIKTAKVENEGVSIDFKDAIAVKTEKYGKEILIYLFPETLSLELKKEVLSQIKLFFIRGKLPKLKGYKHPSYVKMSFSFNDLEKLSKGKMESFHAALCGFAKENSTIMNLNSNKNDSNFTKVIKKFDYKDGSLSIDISYDNDFTVKLKTKVYTQD